MAKSNKYRIRFPAAKQITFAQEDAISNAIKISTQEDLGRANPKSKGGCRECKRMHVKCDEVFPVCSRCQRRGSVCFSEPKRAQFQMVMPGISIPYAPNFTSMLGEHVDSRLLQNWLEQTSHIMVLDPDNNPLSFPILQLLGPCPWLASVLQSISAGFSHGFNQSQVDVALQQRSKALVSYAQQLAVPDPPLAPMLLGTFLLGISSTWIDGDITQFGKDHLFGARTILDLLLKKQRGPKREGMELFAIGAFIYWDMSVSLLVPTCQQKPLNTPEIFEVVCEMQESYHPMSGYAIELYYLLATVGRYCRAVMESGERHLILERTLEGQLLEWQSMSQDNPELVALGESLRQHGLLLLYRICGVQTDNLFETTDKEELIHQHALKGMRAISSLPFTSNHMRFQPIPVLTVGSELREEDIEERAELVRRCQAFYSLNRTPVNIWAMTLLEEVWELRRQGVQISWAELMLQKSWGFSLG